MRDHTTCRDGSPRHTAVSRDCPSAQAPQNEENTPVFRPLQYSPAVLSLLEDSTIVVPRKNLRDNKCELFKLLTHTINATAYKPLGWRSSDRNPYKIAITKTSRFVETFKGSLDPTVPPSNKPTPYYLEAASDSSAPNLILAFASAPKLPRDCHRLTGLLVGKTKEVPDVLHNKDYAHR